MDFKDQIKQLTDRISGNKVDLNPLLASKLDIVSFIL